MDDENADLLVDTSSTTYCLSDKHGGINPRKRKEAFHSLLNLESEASDDDFDDEDDDERTKENEIAKTPTKPDSSTVVVVSSKDQSEKESNSVSPKTRSPKRRKLSIAASSENDTTAPVQAEDLEGSESTSGR